MMKKWLKTPAAGAVSHSATASPLVLKNPVETPPQKLDLIVLPQTAADLVTSDPRQLCDALGGYVSHLLEVGFYTPSEIPAEAMWGYQLGFYLRQTTQGGHPAFLAAAHSTLGATMQDLMSGAMAMGHDGYHALFAQLAAWAVSATGAKADSAGVDDAARLDDFDAAFEALNARDPLVVRLAEWIAGLEITLFVPDEALARVYEGILLMNDKKAPRASSVNLVTFDAMLTEQPQLGLGHVAGSLKTPLIALGQSSMQTVKGAAQRARLVLTSAGQAWGIETAQGYELRHHHKDAGVGAVGDRLGFASHKKIAVARKIVRQTNAAAALDLCLRGLPERCVVDHLSVRSAGLGKRDVVGISIYVIANKGSKAFTLVVTSEGAKLMEEPSHRVLASVTRAQIAAHVQVNATRVAA